MKRNDVLAVVSRLLVKISFAFAYEPDPEQYRGKVKNHLRKKSCRIELLAGKGIRFHKQKQMDFCLKTCVQNNTNVNSTP